MKRPKLSVTSFLFELIIVFVGVYGAFELNRYQERQREEAIKKNYFNSFYSELVKLSYEIKATHGVIDQSLQELEMAKTSGERPVLKPLNLYFGAQMLITKAGFNDDVFTQLDASLSSSLSGGYDHVQAVDQMVKNFNNTCRMHLISTEPISFYDSKGALLPHFSWYEEDLRFLKRNFERLSEMINEGAVPATKGIIKRLD